jgi:hypothetical protein
VRFIGVINVKFKGSKKIKTKDAQYKLPWINLKFKKKSSIYPGSFGIFKKIKGFKFKNFYEAIFQNDY